MSRPKISGFIQGWRELIKKVVGYIDTLPEGENRVAKMLKGSLRDIWFHFWHEYNLPEDSNFSSTDIDFVESIDGHIVALIEVKPFGYYPSSYQMDTYAKISIALKTPFYVIQFDMEGEKPFKIDCYAGKVLQTSKSLSEEELIDFYYEIRGIKRKDEDLFLTLLDDEEE